MTLQDLLNSGYLDEFNILLETNPEEARTHWLVTTPQATTPQATTPQAPARR